MSRINRPPISLSKISTLVPKDQAGLIVAVVGTVVDDERLSAVPKINVAALRFTESARDRIIKVLLPALSPRLA